MKAPGWTKFFARPKTWSTRAPRSNAAPPWLAAIPTGENRSNWRTRADGSSKVHCWRRPAADPGGSPWGPGVDGSPVATMASLRGHHAELVSGDWALLTKVWEAGNGQASSKLGHESEILRQELCGFIVIAVLSEFFLGPQISACLKIGHPKSRYFEFLMFLLQTGYP